MEGSEPAPTLRGRQQEATRLAILDAFLTLSHQDGAVNISIPAVAREAGVSVRTIYRYFATKDALQTAAAYRMSDAALMGGRMNETTRENLQDNLKMLWVSLAEQLPAVIAEHATPAGRAIRTTRLPGAREASQRAFPPEASAEDLDMVIAVTSSSMFLELVDRMGYAPEVAASMATRTAGLILAAARERAHPTQKGTT